MSDVELRWHGDEANRRMRFGAIKGLREATENLLTEANYTIPLETGEMMRSGVPSVDEERLEGAVSYDTPYAVKQHERTDFRHDEGRRAKWLELTLNETRDRLIKHIGDEIRKAMRG